jgi:hypothetical protein
VVETILAPHGKFVIAKTIGTLNLLHDLAYDVGGPPNPYLGLESFTCTDVESWMARACQIVKRNLSQAEWKETLGRRWRPGGS